jgi:carbamoyltransferase
MKTGYIIGLALGHNASICLLNDGEIVFSVEEERLSRSKADGAPLLGLLKVLDYTDKVDYIAIAYPAEDRPLLEYTREHVYSGFARKLGLVSSNDQYLNYTNRHHLTHAVCAFHNSGFESAAVVVVDGAGSDIKLNILDDHKEPIRAYEIESIYNFVDVDNYSAIYKRYGAQNVQVLPDRRIVNGCETIVDFSAGIGRAYDAVTDYLGFSLLECGKTMGLSAYGKPNAHIPNFFLHDGEWSYVNTALITPTFKAASHINVAKFKHINDISAEDIAYKIQQETQQEVLKLIIKASEMSGNKNVCLTGGYALNCVANYYYKEKLNELGINLYVEPNSSDAGTSIGAALLTYRYTKEMK